MGRFALDKKYPNANQQWVWQYVFPASTLDIIGNKDLDADEHGLRGKTIKIRVFRVNPRPRKDFGLLPIKSIDVERGAP